MKVMLVGDCVGGVFSYMLELADALHADHGVEVVVAVMGGEPSPAHRAELAARPWLGVEARAYRLMWMADPWRDVEVAGDWLLQLCERHRPDVVHLNDYAHVQLPWPVPVLLVVHSCVSTWFAAVHGSEPPAQFARYRRVVRAAAVAADFVVAPTRVMLRDFQRCNGPCPKAAVVPNGIAQPLSRALRKGRFATSAGRLWDAAKNLATLDDAARGLDWPVLVAGATRLTDADVATGISNALHLLGELPRHRVRRLLQRSAIHVHPARYEPFGLAPLEAAVHGNALVLADIPTLREIWADAALFAPPDDPAALRAALQRLIRDDRLRNEMAVRARARAAGFTASRMARGYVERYAALLAGSPAAPAP